VDDELYYRARVRAAEKRSTVSALVREFLTRLVDEEGEFERLARQQNELIARFRVTYRGFSAHDRLARDDVHERHEIR
jgi:hypothetical protein